ncbi:MAG: hypothetical protein WKG03_00455 [Telluria sp.]
MHMAIERLLSFADVVLNTMLALDAGKADVAVFKSVTEDAVESFTVGGVWMGDVFSWRMVAGVHDKVAKGEGSQIFGGTGEVLDSTIAAARLCIMLGAVPDRQWTVAM